MTAVLAIFIDVFNDIDIGVPEEVSRSKMVKISAVVAMFDEAAKGTSAAFIQVRLRFHHIL